MLDDSVWAESDLVDRQVTYWSFHNSWQRHKLFRIRPQPRVLPSTPLSGRWTAHSGPARCWRRSECGHDSVPADTKLTPEPIAHWTVFVVWRWWSIADRRNLLMKGESTVISDDVVACSGYCFYKQKTSLNEIEKYNDTDMKFFHFKFETITDLLLHNENYIDLKWREKITFVLLWNFSFLKFICHCHYYN